MSQSESHNRKVQNFTWCFVQPLHSSSSNNCFLERNVLEVSCAFPSGMAEACQREELWTEHVRCEWYPTVAEVELEQRGYQISCAKIWATLSKWTFCLWSRWREWLSLACHWSLHATPSWPRCSTAKDRWCEDSTITFAVHVSPRYETIGAPRCSHCAL